MTRFVAMPIVLVLAAASAAAAQEAQEPAARYVFVPVEQGALRLNTGTGEVSLCTGADGAGACAPVSERRDGQADAAGLEARVAALEARMASLEKRGPVAALTDAESMDRVVVLADRMMRRFVKLVQQMQEDVESGEL